MREGRAPVHPISLCFSAETLEHAFAEDHFQRTCAPMRWVLLMGLVLYASFGLLDPWVVPAALEEVRLIRLAVCAFVLLVLLFTFTAPFKRYTQAVLALVSLVAGLGVVGMDLVAQEIDGYYHYYVGLMLLLFFVHVLLRLRFIYAAAVSWMVIATYDGVALWLTHTPLPLFVNNNFFLISANVSGMFASYLLERYAREVFWQARLLGEKQRRLEAEDARKSRELETARRLQLALLPRQVPAHPALDVAVHMRTATEVGGNYYDFDLADDGTLTFAIGDATGHGAAAGAMVTASKVLFAGLAREPGLAETLRRGNRILRRVRLPGLYMPMALGRFKDATLELAGAGMPPAFIYRAGTGAVEEVSLKGLPLGGSADLPYRQARLELAPGDTVVLMSDGLPELFSPEGEMLGYDPIIKVLRKGARERPEAMIEAFVRAAEAWAGGRAPNDDTTLLVLQMKARPTAPEASTGETVGAIA